MLCSQPTHPLAAFTTSSKPHPATCRKLAGLGVPVLRDLFKQVFGENTASNNAGWLRRKLSETPDGVHGQCRSRVVRARDSGAAIWNKPLIFGAGEGEFGDAGDAAAAAEAEGQGEAGGVLQAPVAVKQEADAEMQEAAGAVPQVCGCWRLLAAVRDGVLVKLLDLAWLSGALLDACARLRMHV